MQLEKSLRVQKKLLVMESCKHLSFKDALARIHFHRIWFETKKYKKLIIACENLISCYNSTAQFGAFPLLFTRSFTQDF
jgi:hypothetical protein